MQSCVSTTQGIPYNLKQKVRTSYTGFRCTDSCSGNSRHLIEKPEARIKLIGQLASVAMEVRCCLLQRVLQEHSIVRLHAMLETLAFHA
jgi:hypothetical protein